MKARIGAYLRINVFKFVFLTGWLVFLIRAMAFASPKFQLKNPPGNQNNMH